MYFYTLLTSAYHACLSFSDSFLMNQLVCIGVVSSTQAKLVLLFLWLVVAYGDTQLKMTTVQVLLDGISYHLFAQLSY